jgi:hypothetical protein
MTDFVISVVPLVSLGQMFSDLFAKFFFLILHRHISKFVNISLMNLELSPLFTLTVYYEHKERRGRDRMVVGFIPSNYLCN